NASAYAKTIIYFGDSRISQWDRYNSDHGVQVVNAGSPGDTSAMALMKLDANVISYKPDVVVVQIGINDLKAIGVMPDEKEFILDNYKNNLNQILDALSSENIDVILLTIFPVGDIDLLRKFVWSSDVTESINEINRYILSLSHQNLTVVDCDKLFSTNGRMNPEYQVDSFHINKLGYEMLNDFLEPYLRKL
ncbi:MAG: GDSL-type esterase/lipase family protein, partial [Gammaproteobacteria bacterium]|nr:GDSL-type esterase/lipase family protein [Gammaproteobacteria bacterium]